MDNMNVFATQDIMAMDTTVLKILLAATHQAFAIQIQCAFKAALLSLALVIQVSFIKRFYLANHGGTAKAIIVW